MSKRTWALLACCGALATGVAACGDDEDSGGSGAAASETQPTEPAPATTEAAPEPAEQDIVALAQATPDLSTLVDAVTAADLVETLQGEGPFTVFAPTNEAFEAVGEDALASLLEPANKDQLADLLTYHVVEGDVKAADLEDGQSVKTVQGGELTVSIEGDTVKVGDATVVMPDVAAANGTVHVIDAVLQPGG